MSLELDLFRVFGRKTDIEAALADASTRLRAHVSHTAAELWALDASHERFARVASTAPTGPAVLRGRAVVEAVMACFEGPRARVVDASDGLALVCGVPERAIVGALHIDRPLGLLVLHGDESARPESVDGVLAPFASALRHALRESDLAVLREAAEADNRALLTRLSRHAIVERVVGEDGGLRDVMRALEQVASTDAPVLLLGETGSGKEVVARALHERSARHAGPMVRVNCGAIAPELVDSELFGHERGSFTGAVGSRKGWFERAHGGTLLLDEIGELPPAAQVRLLRVVQDGTLSRVGAETATHVDVRIVAATHRDLRAMVDEGTFREDLFYRISVFPLRLPALRERREDIPALAHHFAARVGERLAGKAIVPTPEELGALLAYDWPGNVRELAAVIERAAILGQGKRLDVGTALGANVRPRAAPPIVEAAPSRDEPETLDEVTRRHVERTLTRTRGVIEGPSGAAARLGINPHTLRARMRKLGIDWSRFRG